MSDFLDKITKKYGEGTLNQERVFSYHQNLKINKINNVFGMISIYLYMKILYL